MRSLANGNLKKRKILLTIKLSLENENKMDFFLNGKFRFFLLLNCTKLVPDIYKVITLKAFDLEHMTTDWLVKPERMAIHPKKCFNCLYTKRPDKLL